LLHGELETVAVYIIVQRMMAITGSMRIEKGLWVCRPPAHCLSVR